MVVMAGPASSRDGVALGASPVEVPGRPAARCSPCGAGRRCRRAALLDDRQPSSTTTSRSASTMRVQRVVRDQYGDGLELRQMAAQLGPDVQPGPGVQGREGARPAGAVAGGWPVRGPGRRAGPGRRRGGAAWHPRGSARPIRSSHAAARVRASALLAAPAARSEGDVVEGGQVREEQVVLEDDADRAGTPAAYGPAPRRPGAGDRR